MCEAEPAADKVAEEDAATPQTPATAATPTETPVATTPETARETAADAAATSATDTATPVGGAINLVSTESGASLAYDETQCSASFSWSGGPATIVFSRHSSMTPEIMRAKVSGGAYSFHRPWPGQWYWKVESEGGESEVRSFTVNSPVRRNVVITTPSSGGTLAGTGGAINWTGDKGVCIFS